MFNMKNKNPLPNFGKSIEENKPVYLIIENTTSNQIYLNIELEKLKENVFLSSPFIIYQGNIKITAKVV